MVVYADAAPGLAATTILLTTLALLTYGLRVYTRLSRRSWGPEDWIMTGALVRSIHTQTKMVFLTWLIGTILCSGCRVPWRSIQRNWCTYNYTCEAGEWEILSWGSKGELPIIILILSYGRALNRANLDHTVLPYLRSRLLRCYHPHQAQYQLDVDSCCRGEEVLRLCPIYRHCLVHFDEHHRIDLHLGQLHSRGVWIYPSLLWWSNTNLTLELRGMLKLLQMAATANPVMFLQTFITHVPQSTSSRTGWLLSCEQLSSTSDIKIMLIRNRPVPLLWKVQINRNTKISIIGLMGLGILFVIAPFVLT